MKSAFTRIIRVSGEDAADFLQGQLSNDIHRLEKEAGIRAAWCTPKGRVIALFDVTCTDSSFALSAPSDLAETIVERLTLFRFRAKVDMTIESESRTVQLDELIAAGIPFIGAQQTEKFTPHMLNLDLLDAISFDKGCYTGQEIVARTHYRGASKRRVHRYTSNGAVAVGDKVSAGSRAVGEVLNVSDRDLLAVISADKAEDDLSVNGVQIEHQSLPYLQG